MSSKYGREERSGKKDALEEEGYALFQAHQKDRQSSHCS